MAYLYVNTTVVGNGIIQFASSSQYIITASVNGTGVYSPNTNPYKFFLNGKLLGTVVKLGNIISSSVDNSITIPAGTATASFTAYFTPAPQNENAMILKPLASAQSAPIVTLNSMISNPINTTITTGGYATPTSDDYARGFMYRYFYTQANNPNAIIRETSATQFASVSSFYLYNSLMIKWKIVGTSDSAMQTNMTIAQNNEMIMPGITAILARNYLLYWKDSPDIVSVFDVTNTIQTTGA